MKTKSCITAPLAYSSASHPVSAEGAETGKKIHSTRTKAKGSNHQNSLLHQKLWEANVSLQNNLDSTGRTPLNDCTSKLSKLGINFASINATTTVTNGRLHRSSENVGMILQTLSSVCNEHLPQMRPPTK